MQHKQFEFNFYHRDQLNKSISIHLQFTATGSKTKPNIMRCYEMSFSLHSSILGSAVADLAGFGSALQC